MAEFSPTPHPVLPLPTREQALALGPEQTMQLLLKREEMIRLEAEDPFRYGYVLPCWKDAEALLWNSLVLALFGGNGSAKTTFMAWMGVQVLVNKPKSKVLFLHEAEKPSIDIHHKFVYHYLPKEWKPTEDHKMKRTMTTKVNYSIAGGFTDNVFVLPNGSICRFGSYKQDVGDYEGGGWDLICADENLPISWLKTLVIRLPRCGGRLLWAFTAIRGITPAMKHVVDGAVTVESRPAELIPQDRKIDEKQDWPVGFMPYIQRCIWPKWSAMYFFSEMNPWSGYPDLKLLLSTMSQADVERRAYGYARNNVRTLFPRFSAVHIVEPETIPTTKVSTYHVMDPAGVRNMFMLWMAVDEHGRRYVVDEWPDVPSMGDWAVTSENPNRWDGDIGPAQQSIGYGVLEYKRLILEREGNMFMDGKWVMCGLPIEERFIDPRSGAAGAIADQEGGSSLIDRFAEEQTDKSGKIIGPEMDFRAASGQREREGLDAINDLFAYNTGQPITALINEPKLFISSRCQNLIWALQNYTGHDLEKAACKDPIDDLRYLALEEMEYLPDNRPRQGRVRSY